MEIFLNRKPLLTSFFFLDRAPGQESKRRRSIKWRQASLLVNLLLSFLKIKKTWEFFSRIAQFFNLQIGFTWKFHLSRHSRFRRPSLFPHSLPADFSPSLTNLVNTIYKGKTSQTFYFVLPLSTYFECIWRFQCFRFEKASSERTPQICSLFPL